MSGSDQPPMPPPMVAPGPDVDRGARLVVTHVVGCAASILFVALRFWARWSIRAIGGDDWCMLGTVIFYIVLTVLASIFSMHGGTRHLFYLVQDPPTMVLVTKLNWNAQTFGICCTTLGKVAIGITILRVLDRASKWRKWSIYVAMGVNVLTGLLMIIINYSQCKDVNGLWDPVAKAKTTCWDPKIQSTFVTCGSSINTFMDFFFAILPVTLVWQLKLNLKKKIALGVLLGCGFVTGIVSAFKTSHLSSLSARSDLTWETFDLYIWNAVECTLIIVLGSLPPLRPLYNICTGRGNSTRATNTSANGYGNYKISALRSTRNYRNVDSDTTYPLVSVSAPENTIRHDSGKGGVHVTKTFETSWSTSSPDEGRGDSR